MRAIESVTWSTISSERCDTSSFISMYALRCASISTTHRFVSLRPSFRRRIVSDESAHPSYRIAITTELAVNTTMTRYENTYSAPTHE